MVTKNKSHHPFSLCFCDLLRLTVLLNMRLSGEDLLDDGVFTCLYNHPLRLRDSVTRCCPFLDEKAIRCCLLPMELVTRIEPLDECVIVCLSPPPLLVVFRLYDLLDIAVMDVKTSLSLLNVLLFQLSCSFERSTLPNHSDLKVLRAILSDGFVEKLAAIFITGPSTMHIHPVHNVTGYTNVV